MKPSIEAVRARLGLSDGPERRHVHDWRIKGGLGRARGGACPDLVPQRIRYTCATCGARKSVRLSPEFAGREGTG